MPGVKVQSRETSPSRTAPTDTGPARAVGVLERGPSAGPFKVINMAEFIRKAGARLATTARLWDAVQTFFKYGGRELWLQRLLGPAATPATANLLDGAAGVSLVATAVGDGAWYNGINLTVIADGANRSIRVTHDTDTDVDETSPSVATQQELVDWSQFSDFIRLAIGASALMPAAGGPFNLAGGDDDIDGITDADRIAALELFDPELGSGQICVPGGTTAAIWAAVLDIADVGDWTAILAYPDTDDEATHEALAETARGRGRFGGGFGPWLREPGDGGTVKTVAPELAVCGKIAGHDAATSGLGQNKPVAGTRRGQLRRCLGVTQSWDKATRDRLNAFGFNVIRELPQGGVVIWGWRTLVDPEADPAWINLGHRRLHCALVAKLNSILEEFVFDEIDGQGTLLGNVNGAIGARVAGPYFQVGSLYGDSPEEAYRVDTDSVNTPETIQNRELHAALTVVESEFAEELTVEVIKKMITEGV